MTLKAFIAWIGTIGLLAALLAPSAGAAMPASGSIHGTTRYTGEYDTDHEVLVSAHLNPGSEPVASVHTWGPGDYVLDGVPDGSYYLSAFLDIHDRSEGPPEFGEPFGWYDHDGDGNPDPVTVSGGLVSEIDITMNDVDSEYIQGTACYLGGVDGPGQLEVGLHLQPGDPPVTSQYLSRPCEDYIFNGGPPGSYYVSLFFDANDSGGPPEAGEPIGWYDSDGDGSPDPVVYSGEVITGVNVTVGGIHYVDFSASGSGDGNSWEEAFTDLKPALAAAQPGEEVWVASGVYTPGSVREASFILPHGVAVYGGFNGTEDYRRQRNPRLNVTVLSGEIGDPASKEDNAFHVVTTASTYLDPVDATTVLDGFTITGGYADVEANQTEKGGGMLNNYGSPTLVNLNFVDNYAFNHGGALATQYNSEPLTLVNCTFSGNHSGHNAGGIANFAQLRVVNSSLVDNTGPNGGGIVNLDGSHAEIHNTILWGNQGAEIALQGSATATVSSSLVEGGYAGGSAILSDDPALVDADGPDDLAGTLDDDLHLQAGSPAIDAGDNNQVPVDAGDSDGNGDTRESTPLDMDAGLRRVDDPDQTDTGSGTAPLVDMGADEYATPQAIEGLWIAASLVQTDLSQAIPFAARASDGTQVQYAWDFGDGEIAAGPLPIYAYQTPGVYTVTLTASNPLGSQQAQTQIRVVESLDIEPGGSSTTVDGALSLQVPAAISGTLTIGYTPLGEPAAVPGGFEFAGMAFELQAYNEAGQAIIEPSAPITLTVHYDESQLPPGTEENSLVLQRYDPGSGEWLPLWVVSRDPANDSLTVMLDHFSDFALFAAPEEPEPTLYLPVVVY